MMIKEIAVRHGVAVGRDDPILMLLTIFERLQRDGEAAQHDQLEKFKSEIESTVQRVDQDAQVRATKAVVALLDASKDGIKKTAEDGAGEAVGALKALVDATVAQMRKDIGDTRKVAIFNMVAAVLSLVAALIVAWAAV
ncbi:conjugal transfer protein TraM [Azohydromonas lata]|uniref:Conjugal transfer protein TraM n=1 Tax=Azohydromonas lata TaxID=45677 RepID=A0ABU5IK75_9BURK|nr:conjugal transfer protein TraM [Azohydromonas lata]MDZ5459303.1 conjugal transfer protein TraM [Azohydromonas lata]